MDRIAFLAATTKQQANQHMADRPPLPITSVRIHTGFISQNVSPFLHFKGECGRTRGKSRHDRLRIVWNSLLSY